MSDSLKVATIALLDKLDKIQEAIQGIFMLAYSHGVEYDGPNWQKEYAECRTLTNTTSKIKREEDGKEI